MSDEATDSAENNENDSEFEFTLEGPGVKISRSVPADRLPALLAVLLGTADIGDPFVVAEGTGEPESSQSRDRPRRTPAEFLGETKAKTNAEKIAAFAWYQEEHGESGVKREQLEGLFRQAGQTVPGNLARDIRNAEEKRLIGEDPSDPDLFYVTSTGREQLRRDGDEAE